MHRIHALPLLAALLAFAPALVACPGGDEGEAPIIDDERLGDIDCDSLDDAHCLFPFPSDYFREVEDGMGRLVFGDYAIPSGVEGQGVDASEFRRAAGWSAINPIYLVLPGATLEGAPSFEAIDDSLSPESKTLVIDRETGELMPHWAEFDHFAEKQGVAVIALRLARRLKSDTRYVVAIRDLVAEDGTLVAPTPGFGYLRDKKPSRLRGVGARREHYEQDIFPLLEGLGVDREELQLAWDFTTDTEEKVTGTLLRMRDLLLEAVGEDGPEYEITAVIDNPHPSIAVMVRGIAKIPSFLDGVEGDVRRIRRDADGQPFHQGFEDIPFSVQIPHSVMNGEKVGRVVQYGHGLLGTMGQAEGGWLRDQAEEYGYVILGSNMQGMDDTDTALWVRSLTSDLALLPLLSEKPHQGLVNHVALARMMRGGFSKDEDPRYTLAGAAAYDPDHIYYYGISQGGTLGAVMMSIQTEITRGVLGVPGGAFTFLLSRSTAFEEMALPLYYVYPDPIDFIAVLGLAQVGFDRVDPINYVHRMTENPFPNTPPHRVLLQVGKEDGQVNIQVTDILSRTVDAALLVPSPRPVWGLEETTGPHPGNASSEYCFGRPDNPRSNYPVDLGGLTDPHMLVRRVPEAQAQIDHFYVTGEAKNFCDGACEIEGM